MACCSMQCPCFLIAVLFLAFFTSNYCMFIVNPQMLILDQVTTLTPMMKSAFSSAALFGIVVGEIAIGKLADTSFGYSASFVLTLSFTVLGSLLGGTSLHMFVLVTSRFLLGLGIGGSVPLTAVIAAGAHNCRKEKDDRRTKRQQQMTTLLVFSSQGFACAAANAVSALTLWPPLNISLDVAWRLCGFLGAVLAATTLMAFQMLPASVKVKAASSSQHHSFSLSDMVIEHGRALLGTGGTWFCFDIMFYANSLFSALVMDDIFGRSSAAAAHVAGGGGGAAVAGQIAEAAAKTMASHHAFEVMIHNLYLSLFPLLGFVAAAIYVGWTTKSLRSLQLIGFICMTAVYFLLAQFYVQLRASPWLFVLVYAATFLFANAGPNSTTFILPTVVFTSHTATCHGLSAAAGKVGAMVGSSGMAPLLLYAGPQLVFSICGIVGIFGALLTVLFIPHEAALTSGPSLGGGSSSGGAAPTSPTTIEMDKEHLLSA